MHGTFLQKASSNWTILLQSELVTEQPSKNAPFFAIPDAVA
jgi:hypothetical protein